MAKQFSERAIERIGKAVNFAETREDGTLPHGPTGEEEPLAWYKLTANLHATTHDANANPGKWSASAGSGAGALTADTTVTRKVRDTTAVGVWFTGDWVLCRPWGSTNGTIWEIVSRPSCQLSYWGTMSATLNAGSSANASVVINGTAQTVLVYDNLLTGAQTIASAAKILATFHPDEQKWYAEETACS